MGSHLLDFTPVGQWIHCLPLLYILRMAAPYKQSLLFSSFFNYIKPFNSPQPEFQGLSFFFTIINCFKCGYVFIDKLVAITEPTVPSAQTNFNCTATWPGFENCIQVTWFTCNEDLA